MRALDEPNVISSTATLTNVISSTATLTHAHTHVQEMEFRIWFVFCCIHPVPQGGIYHANKLIDNVSDN
jgi:hypothetical protein